MSDKQLPFSDTVTITPDGRSVVDMKKLFAKPHIQEMLEYMRQRTVRVPAPPAPRPAPKG